MEDKSGSTYQAETPSLTIPTLQQSDTTRLSWRKTRDFGKRQDVINKTLLRSIKKHLTSDFNKENGFESLSFDNKIVHFRAFLEAYVDAKYPSKSIIV